MTYPEVQHLDPWPYPYFSLMRNQGYPNAKWWTQPRGPRPGEKLARD